MPVAPHFRLASFFTGQAFGALKPLQHLLYLRYPTPTTPQRDDAIVAIRYWLKRHWPGSFRLFGLYCHSWND